MLISGIALSLPNLHAELYLLVPISLAVFVVVVGTIPAVVCCAIVNRSRLHAEQREPSDENVPTVETGNPYQSPRS